MFPGNWSQLSPDHPAIIEAHTGKVVSYRELDERSNQLAWYFRERGLEAGDHVAILMANRAEFLEVCWAAQRSGLYYTPINWHLTDPEARYILEDCDARVLIAGPEHAETATDLVAGLRDVSRLVVGARVAGADNYEDIIADMATHAVPNEAEGFDMIYTSGTTGRPKGGTRPLPGLVPSDENPEQLGFFELFGFGRDMVYLSPGAPLYHAAPLRFCVGTHRFGGTCVIMDAFDPLLALRAIEQFGVTHSQWVPTMFVRLLRLAGDQRNWFDLSTHRVAIHAAAACARSVKYEMMTWWGPILHEYYGASEGGVVTYIGPEEWLAHPGSVGRAVIGTIRILDDSGTELPSGQTGMVFGQGAVPIDYYKDPEKTGAAYSPHGWGTVGDMGYVDEDGYLFLADRRDNLIIAGGVNIYPQEVEDVLIRHAAVADAAVIGVPNSEYGEEVKAVVQPSGLIETGPALEHELIELCRHELAAYKCPRTVDFDPDLPRAPSGKLYKRRLLERYWPESDDVDEVVRGRRRAVDRRAKPRSGPP